jgi:zinc transport system permease protein
MTSIGLLLISAMMVVPVAAAAQIANSYRGTLGFAAAIGWFSAVAGLLVSHYGDYAPGSAIVLAAIGCYLLASAWRPLAHRTSSSSSPTADVGG